METSFEQLEQLAAEVSALTSDEIGRCDAGHMATVRAVRSGECSGCSLCWAAHRAAVLLFSFRVVRPLRQIDRAITNSAGGALPGPSRFWVARLEKLGRQLEWLRLRLTERPRNATVSSGTCRTS